MDPHEDEVDHEVAGKQTDRERLRRVLDELEVGWVVRVYEEWGPVYHWVHSAGDVEGGCWQDVLLPIRGVLYWVPVTPELIEWLRRWEREGDFIPLPDLPEGPIPEWEGPWPKYYTP